jgi:hypothetical protein
MSAYICQQVLVTEGQVLLDIGIDTEGMLHNQLDTAHDASCCWGQLKLDVNDSTKYLSIEGGESLQLMAETQTPLLLVLSTLAL